MQRLLPRTLLWTLSQTIPGRPAPHLWGVRIQRPMLLPRPVGHPSQVLRVALADQPATTSPVPHPPLLQAKSSWPLPSPPTSSSGHSPAVVGFHSDLVRMVPAASACDRVRHGGAVPLGRHLLTPPPQRRRPRVPGARRGTPRLEPLPEPRPPALLPALLARGADPRVASPGQPEPRGSSHCPQPPPPLQPPGPSTPPRLGPSHLARSKGPHSGGGRAQPPIQLKEPPCPAEPFLQRARKKGEREWEMLILTSNTPGGRLSWKL